MTPSQETEHATWSREEFVERLASKRSGYHLEHAFEVLMNEGKLTPDALRGWVLNRFYYQVSIPRKDAAILANCPQREVRRAWTKRILDQDGTGDGPEECGGIEAWIRLGEACGIPREEITSLRHVLPSVRFAVDAYVNFARSAPWQEAICSSLTELFAGEAHAKRLAAFPIHYAWVAPEGLAYFRARQSQSKRDVHHGLEVTLAHFTTRAQQERALEILQFKMDVLWSILDAIHGEYVLGSKRSTLK
jgi:pyrroloquinoline-quinone synthase